MVSLAIDASGLAIDGLAVSTEGFFLAELSIGTLTKFSLVMCLIFYLHRREGKGGWRTVFYRFIRGKG